MTFPLDFVDDDGKPLSATYWEVRRDHEDPFFTSFDSLPVRVEWQNGARRLLYVIHPKGEKVSPLPRFTDSAIWLKTTEPGEPEPVFSEWEISYFVVIEEVFEGGDRIYRTPSVFGIDPRTLLRDT